MKKFLLWICIMILPLSLISCSGPYTDDDAAEILGDLLVKDAELNRYIYGDGFSTRDDPGEDADKTTSIYYRVNEDAPYHSVDELKAAISSLYSEEVCEMVYAYAFETTDTIKARFCDFYQNDAVADLQIDVTLNHPPYELETVIYPSTAKVTRSSATIIEADVEYSNGPDGEHRQMEVRLLKEGDIWKLDTRTWAGSVG